MAEQRRMHWRAVWEGSTIATPRKQVAVFKTLGVWIWRIANDGLEKEKCLKRVWYKTDEHTEKQTNNLETSKNENMRY